MGLEVEVVPAVIPAAAPEVIPATVPAVAAVASAVEVRAAEGRRGSGRWRVCLACANQRRYADGFMSLFDKLFI